jgi:hypothetical protein
MLGIGIGIEVSGEVLGPYSGYILFNGISVVFNGISITYNKI